MPSRRSSRSGCLILSRLFIPFIVLAVIAVGIVYLPEVFPDHGVIYRAILDDDLERARWALDKGVDPDSRRAIASELSWFLLKPTRRSGGEAPDLGIREPLLHIAMHHNRVEIAKLLLERGADPNVRDEVGFTALNKAVSLGDASLVRLMLEKGADPRATMPDGSTALREGPELRRQLRTRDPEIIRMLTEGAPGTRP